MQAFNSPGYRRSVEMETQTPVTPGLAFIISRVILKFQKKINTAELVLLVAWLC